MLRTNIPDWSPEDLWRTYVQLATLKPSSGFRKVPSPCAPSGISERIESRPISLVCFLSYVLWKTLEQWQQRAGLGRSPRTILEELRTIQSTDVVLPTTDEREVRLRCVVRPDRAQAALLDRLGLDLPHQLRLTSPLPTATPV